MRGHLRSPFVGAFLVATALAVATSARGDEWTDFHFALNPATPTDQEPFGLSAWRWFSDSGYDLQSESISVTGNQIDLTIVVRDYHFGPGGIFLTVMTPVGVFYNDFGPLAAGEYQVNAQMWKTFSPNHPGDLFQEATFHFSVAASQSLVGDYNGDGVVDVSDYTVWRDSAGMTGANLAADGNHDEAVDDDDYAMWKNHFGDAIENGSAAVSSAAPEPGSQLLMVSGLVAAICYVRRR